MEHRLWDSALTPMECRTARLQQCSRAVTQDARIRESAVHQARQLVQIQFETHAALIMMRLILRALHGMTYEFAGDEMCIRDRRHAESSCLMP